ncbi:O-antigen ligase family protein [Butyrivibrio sp. VCB2001]|uniref:O-antigen ligase family protein n=1 Tax=Butyrivibrio sp. VCB2001 TaxID=1280667 RepID=UPI000414D6AB|nr:O-antigen ligase family protein [Butyrivibrio sp. VCB2001]
MNGVFKIEKILRTSLLVIMLILMCEGFTIIQNSNKYLFILGFLAAIGLFLCKEEKVINFGYKNPFVILLSAYLIFDYFVINYESTLIYVYYLIIWLFVLVLLLDMGESFFRLLINGVYYFTIFEMVTVLLELATKHLSLLVLKPLYSNNIYASIVIIASRGYYVGVVGEKAAAAFWLIIGLSMFLVKHVKKGESISIKTIIGTALFMLCIALTAKRTIIVFAIILIASQFLLVNYSKKTITVFVLIIVAMAGAYFVYQYVPAVQLMIDRFSSSTEDLSTMNSRTMLWDYAKEMFHARPVFGWGRGTFHLDSPNNMEGHNVYLQNFAENGIVGGCLWMLTYASGLITLIYLYIKTHDELVKILMFSQGLFLLYSLTENVLFTTSFEGYYIVTFIGLSYALKKFRTSDI